jgi:RHS repeat-associated protein
MTAAASSAAADDVTYAHDGLGEIIDMTDQNGTTHDYTYDSLGRETLDSVTTLGGGVDGTVRAIGTTFNTQGLPNLETSYSNANGTGVVNQDEDIYNGLGQLTGEFQAVSGAVNTSSTPEVQYAFSDPSLGSRQTSETYPNGRVVDDVYNSGINTTIGRISSIADAAGSSAGNLQSYVYQGVGTIIGFADGNGVTENTTLNSFGESAEIKYVNSSSVTTDDFAYGFDRDGNVLYKNNLLSSANSDLYHANSAASGDNNTAYDPLSRLGAFERGTLSASGNNGSTLDTVASPSASQSFNLNAVGDQNSVTTGTTTVTNTTNAKNELTSNGSNSLTFDNNGNTLTDENGLSYTFDAWNHEATVKSGNTTLAVYSNDPTGRRVTESSGNTTTAIYFSDQWQPIELRQGATVTSQNVFGLGYVNQLVERDDNSASGSLGKTSSGLGQRLYAQQNVNFSTTTLVDNTGNVVQRMAYLPFGGVIFLTNAWAAGSNTAALRSLYQGGWLETATGNYIFQHRDYDPATGTWKEPDPDGYGDSMSMYQFVLENPLSGTDPEGALTEDLAKDLVTDLSRKEGDSGDVLPRNASFARQIFAMLGGDSYSDAVQNLGTTVLFAPLKALPGGLIQHISVDVLSNLVDTALSGKIDYDKVVEALQANAIEGLAPEEIQSIVDSLTKIADNAAKSGYTSKLYGPGRFVDLSFNSPFKGGLGYHVSGQFYVSAKTKHNGWFWSSKYGPWTVLGSVKFTYTKGYALLDDARQAEDPCSGSFDLNASGGNEDYTSEPGEYKIAYKGFNFKYH